MTPGESASRVTAPIRAMALHLSRSYGGSDLTEAMEKVCRYIELQASEIEVHERAHREITAVYEQERAQWVAYVARLREIRDNPPPEVVDAGTKVLWEAFVHEDGWTSDRMPDLVRAILREVVP